VEEAEGKSVELALELEPRAFCEVADKDGLAEEGRVTEAPVL